MLNQILPSLSRSWQTTFSHFVPWVRTIVGCCTDLLVESILFDVFLDDVCPLHDVKNIDTNSKEKSEFLNL